jgi:hypothetical protein
MYNLGRKHIVLNTVDSNNMYITLDAGGVIKNIDGYMKFREHLIEDVTIEYSIDKVSEFSNWVIQEAIAEKIIVEITLGKRNVDRKKRITFTAASSAYQDILIGYENFRNIYSIYNPLIELTADATSVSISVADWEPEVFVRTFTIEEIKPSAFSTGAEKQSLKRISLQPGNNGTLYGHQIEESIRFGSFANTNPYGERHGGNSQGIKLDGRYALGTIIYNNDGDREHEFIKHSGVGIDSHHGKEYFSIYILDEGDNIQRFIDIFTGIFNYVFDNTFN